MDHILRSIPGHTGKPLEGRFKVRCYAKEGYNGGDFISFPEEHGWGARSPRSWRSLMGAPTDDFQAMIQRWTYFGTLSAFLGRPVAVEEVTSSADDGKLYFDTSRLVLLLLKGGAEAGARAPEYDDVSFYAVYGQVDFLHVVWRASESMFPGMAALNPDIDPDEPMTLWEFFELAREVEFFVGGDPREPTMVAAQSALHEAIPTVITVIAEAKRGPLMTYAAGGPSDVMLGGTHEGGALSDLMLAEGWCTSEISMIVNSFSVTGVTYILASLDRPNMSFSHNQDRVSPCTRYSCGLYQIDQNAYERAHAENCTGCSDIGVVPTELWEILQQGQIPLIYALDPEDDRDHVQLIPFDGTLDYVAFSHIWADGLGNLDSNSIPRCQMLRLSEQVRQLYSRQDISGPVLFWLDSLCCPPDSAGRDEEQQMALYLMRQTYEDAHTVLVLDKWLYKQPLPQHETIDSFLKLIISPWTRRLWTLQEGGLPHRLLIKSAEGFFDPDAAVEALRVPFSVDFEQFPLRKDILRKWHNIRGFREMTGTQKFHALYSSLAFRTTSVREDERLCLGALFGFDVGNIAKVKGHEGRMLEFWKSYTHVPTQVLHVLEERLQVPGYRWAPRTLLGHDDRVTKRIMLPEAKSADALRTESGLETVQEGFELFIGETALRSFFFLRQHDGSWRKVTVLYETTNDMGKYDLVKMPSGAQTPGIAPYKAHDSETIALISRPYSGKIFNRSGIIGSVQDDRVRRFGTYTMVRISPGDPTFMKLESHINSEAFREYCDGLQENEKAIADESCDTLIAAFAETAPAERTWRVD